MSLMHTPTPWVWVKKPTDIGAVYKVGSQAMVDGTHGSICLYDDRSTLNPHAHGVQGANAAFIVKAVNAHYEMHSLLEEAAKRVREDPAGDHELADRIDAKLASLAAAGEPV